VEPASNNPWLYLRLAASIEEMIGRRLLRPGDRIPSVRRFSMEQRVSVPTALHAYAILETRGLIAARPRSGFYVSARSADSLSEPDPAVSLLKARALSPADPFESLTDNMARDLVPFGVALPSPALLPVGKLTRTMASIGRRLGPAAGDYDFAPGCLALRREVARRAAAAGCSLAAEDLIVTLGGTEAINLALRCTCEPGDTVVIESPTFFGIVRQLREMRLKALPIPVDSRTGICLDTLDRATRRTRVAACVLVPNFHNPIGFVMPDARKRELVRLLGGRGIPLIEDDVYGELQHEGPRPRCAKAFDPDGSVILCGSYSKTLSPGYRVGFLAAGRWHERALGLKKIQTLAGPTLPSLAVAEFLRNGGYDRHLRSFREACRRQVEETRAAICRYFPEGTRISRPSGGHLLWCELPGNVDSLELFREAAAAGISIAPGPVFSSDGGFRNFVRISCGHPWSSRLDQSLAVLGRLARKQARIPGAEQRREHPLRLHSAAGR
jgi:DNA-binding transcriptional MocR family regulator